MLQSTSVLGCLADASGGDDASLPALASMLFSDSTALHNPSPCLSEGALNPTPESREDLSEHAGFDGTSSPPFSTARAGGMQMTS